MRSFAGTVLTPIATLGSSYTMTPLKPAFSIASESFLKVAFGLSSRLNGTPYSARS
ncbi:MAG: hypothetical protein IPG04_09470 [Polyangiaceae bacterium]|nr:hypothetical protein [Polyangiaceae bacterium]